MWPEELRGAWEPTSPTAACWPSPTTSSTSRSTNGFLLDGFPRTIPQADALDAALSARRGIEAVVHYVLDDEEIVRRSLKRGRSDDTEPVIRERLRVYRAQTAPLVARYRKAGLLVDVAASGTIDEVEALTKKALASRRGRGAA